VTVREYRPRKESTRDKRNSTETVEIPAPIETPKRDSLFDGMDIDDCDIDPYIEPLPEIKETEPKHHSYREPKEDLSLETVRLHKTYQLGDKTIEVLCDGNNFPVYTDDDKVLAREKEGTPYKEISITELLHYPNPEYRWVRATNQSGVKCCVLYNREKPVITRPRGYNCYQVIYPQSGQYQFATRIDRISIAE
jgi:hypothetical protein